MLGVATAVGAQTSWTCDGREATLVGTPGPDTLVGTAGSDVIVAREGNDVIRALGGDDVVCAGKGNDTIYGGNGFDIIYGAQGNDTIYSAAGSTPLERQDVRGARMFGGAGNDIIYGSNRWDRMQGGLGTDQLFGFEGRDWIRAGGGNDAVDGGTGVDDLHGGNGRDTIELTAGDLARGGAGLDLCNLAIGEAGSLRSCGLNLREHPAPPRCREPSQCSHHQGHLAPYNVNVFSLRFLPDVDGDGLIDPQYSGFTSPVSVDDLRRRIDVTEREGAWWATEATRYHGYRNDDAPPSINFRIALTREEIASPKIGNAVPWNDAHYPDYMAIMTEHNICDLVDHRGIDEVWMYTQHHGDIEPAESNMSSPVGDYSNSLGTDDLPICDKPYVVYNFNFTRDADTLLHNRGHQVEAHFGRLRNDPGHPDHQLFVTQFIGSSSGFGPLNTPRRCGNVHLPPNTRGDDYVTWLTDEVVSDCESWAPGGGQVSTLTCADWFEPAYGDPTCFDDGGLAHVVWWFQNLPGLDNGLVGQGRPLRNWWQIMGDFESVMDEPTWLTVSD